MCLHSDNCRSTFSAACIYFSMQMSVKGFLETLKSKCFTSSSVGPDLGPNSLQRLSADNKRKEADLCIWKNSSLQIGSIRFYNYIENLTCVLMFY